MLHVCLCTPETGLYTYSYLPTREKNCRSAFRQACANATPTANNSAGLTLLLSLSPFFLLSLPKIVQFSISVAPSLPLLVSFPPLLPDTAQLYQQYSEAAQNIEIKRQARSDVVSVYGDSIPSPSPSPPPACRPLPPIPPVPHPHSLLQVGPVTSVRNLPLPEPPKSESRPPSPRLSISLSQSATLWRELPGVQDSAELEKLTDDQRRLQEVTRCFTAQMNTATAWWNLFLFGRYKGFLLM